MRSSSGIKIVVMLVLAVLAIVTAPRTALAGGTVGSGTPASCDEAALNGALGGGGLINFSCGGVRTITITSYKQIADDTTIDGGGLITLSGSNSSLFQVFFSKSLTLTHIALASGRSNVTGGIENFGTTTIIGSQLLNNQSTIRGGAILNHGTLILMDSTLTGNQAATGVSAIIDDSQIISNSAHYGAGIENSGAIMVTNSAISRNRATQDGGGLWNLNGQVSLQDVSVSANQAGAAGGGMYQGSGNATLLYVTVAGNTAAFGAGLCKDGSSPGTMFLRDCLLSGNVTGNCDGVVGSAGHNMSSDSHCASFVQPGDKQSVQLLLAPLANNGGPTLTQMPLAGNPAINGGDCISGITIDQRSATRPVGSTCDVGAVEFGALAAKTYVPLCRNQ